MTAAVEKIAVLGTGSIGMRHLIALHAIPSVKVWAVPIRKARLTQLRDEGFQTCADVAAAAAQGVNAVIIATDTKQHVKNTLTALQLGLHVLVEKPVARTASETVELRHSAAAADRKIYVGFVLRFAESLRLFRRWLTRAGRLHAVAIECRSYLPDWRPHRAYQKSYSARADEGGVLRDLTHEIDYAGWIFGWPSALQARVHNLGRLRIEADEIAEISWENSDGALVSINLDYLTRPPRRTMRAFGEHGTLKWDGIAQKVSWRPADANSCEERVLAQSHDEMLLAQTSAFLTDCVAPTTQTSLANLEDGIKSIAICDAAREASVTHRKEIVRYP